MTETSSRNIVASIDDELVTVANPARTDLGGMDHVRCAALHNYLVDYRLAAEGLAPADNGDTFMSTLGVAASAILPKLHPSVAAFLAAARAPRAPFFFFADGFPDAADANDLDGLFDNGLADLYSEPEDCLVRLYCPVIESGGECGGGLIYHQARHVAAFFMHMDDMDYALPIDEHPMNWHPLETILTNWISLIRLGKVVASPAPTGLFGSEKVGPWEWQSYGDGQVSACVAAWDRLCGAIEARQGAVVDDDRDHPGEHGALLTTAALDAANIPNPSFARDFLRLARRPAHIQHIAPGLSMPPADGPSFAAAQPYARLLRPEGDTGTTTTSNDGEPVVVPPVYIFFSSSYDPPVDVASWRPWFRERLDDERVAPLLPSRVPAGLYTEGVSRGRDLDCAEEGFRLLLPFAVAARKSDESEVDDGVAGDLFQHGYKPFGGDYHRPQRLERLLDHWAGLIRRGVWAVGPEGVEGGVDIFRHAGDPVGGMDYVIPPSW